jgi:hypothetical protein
MSDPINIADFEGMPALRVGFGQPSQRTPNDLTDLHYPLFDERNGCVAHVFKKEHGKNRSRRERIAKALAEHDATQNSETAADQQPK